VVGFVFALGALGDETSARARVAAALALDPDCGEAEALRRRLSPTAVDTH